MRVAVLSGGRSSEHDVSLRSGAAVARGLREAGHEAVEVTIAARRALELRRRSPVELVAGRRAARRRRAFPALHGPFGEDGSVQGLLEWLDVPYVGSDVLASAVCMDKLTLKRLFAERGVPQVEFAAVEGNDWRERCERAGPAALGQALAAGLERRHHRVDRPRHELDAAVELALRHDPRVIVEASAAGREVECSVLGNERGRGLAAGRDRRPRRLVRLRGQVHARAAWSWSSRPRSARRRSTACASWPSRVFALGGCSGLARCDFFVEPDGAVLVNEINTMPGFTETSVYAKLWEATGIAYPTSATASSRWRSSATAQRPLARVLSRAPARTSSS